MQLSDTERMRRADALAMDRGISGVTLMLNAAEHIARAALALMGPKRRAVIFCGSGNNGGDGMAAALHLLDAGCAVRVLLCGSREKLTADAGEMARRLQARGTAVEDFAGVPALAESLSKAGVLIDALFGLGLSRPPAGSALEAIRLMNASPVPVVSADLPSGVAADTGEIPGEAVRAAVTVTFSLAKPGHFLEPGCTVRGQLEVGDIGIPAEILAGSLCPVTAVTGGDVSLPRRSPLTHKGDCGKVLIVGGSVGYTGAPALAAQAAVRAGAGLVYVGVPRSIWPVEAAGLTAAMPFPLPEDGDGRLTAAAAEPILGKLALCDVLVLGPGLGRTPDTAALVHTLTERAQVPVLLDADALWAIGQRPELLTRAAHPPVLTPHDGEFARLGGDMGPDRLGAARAFAENHRCVVVRKGHRTVCAFPDGDAFIVCAGNPGMATGGSGDVLAGVIGGLLGQLPPARAVVTGAWLQARAGDLAAERLGEYALSAPDILTALPEAEKEITEV